MSFPKSELKTTYAPMGKEIIIIPKITEANAEYGIARTLNTLLFFCKV